MAAPAPAERDGDGSELVPELQPATRTLTRRTGPIRRREARLLVESWWMLVNVSPWMVAVHPLPGAVRAGPVVPLPVVNGPGFAITLRSAAGLLAGPRTESSRAARPQPVRRRKMLPAAGWQAIARFPGDR
jgi:hypothetical protein